MKNIAAYLVEDQKIELREASIPELGPTDVLVETKCVGVCGSDVHFFMDHTLGGRRKDIQLPIMLGHEASGVVCEVGSKVKTIKPGDLVALEPSVPCGNCRFCRSGRYNLCENMDMMAAPPFHRGAFQKYIVHPEAQTFCLPKSMNAVQGALLEPLSVGMHAAARGGVGAEDKVVILGVGCIGIMTMLACKAHGVTDITVVDLFENRLEEAKKFGNVKTICTKDIDIASYFQENELYTDVVFETAGNAVTVGATPYLARKGGKIVLVGNVQGTPQFSFITAINKELDILGVFRYHDTYPACIDAVANGKIAVENIVGASFPFEEIQTAMEVSFSQKNRILKTVISF